MGVVSPKGCIALFFLFAVITLPGQAAADHSRENAAKAAFVYTFAKFVQWPSTALDDSTTQVFSICHTGKSDITEQLLQLTGKTIREHPTAVSFQEKVNDGSNCHLLFVGWVSDQEMAAITRLAAEKNILTVSDTDGFAEHGGMIGLFREGEKLRFKVNLDAVRNSSLIISSRMLNLAHLIEEESNTK